MKLVFIFLQLSAFLFISCNKSSVNVIRVPENGTQVETANSESESDPELTPNTNNFRDISSVELVQEMGVGWNLGNSFDVISRDKTAWGNPLPNKNTIDAVSQLGFKTLRIPVTWQFHQSSSAPFLIETPYLNQVQQAVDDGLENKMHVIINVHHDDSWIIPTAENATAVKDRLGALWTQVAKHFQHYGDSLLFETLNEPRLKDSPKEWSGGTLEGRRLLNDYNKTCLEAIRKTGGNNAKRHIMIPTYAASTFPFVMNELEIPNDDPNVIISLHSYYPWAFAGLAEISWGSDQDKAELLAEFDKIKEKWLVQEKRAVILGEWGTIGQNSINERIDYAEFYTKEAMARGLLPIVWDDGGNFKLFDRHTLQWSNLEIAETIIQAASK